MAKTQTTPAPTSLSLTETVSRLGLSIPYVLSEAFAGRLEPTEDGRLTVASVERFDARRKAALLEREVR